MGRHSRRSRQLVNDMQTATWWQRLRVLFAYANAPRRPWRLQGVDALRWLVTGDVPRRRYGQR